MKKIIQKQFIINTLLFCIGINLLCLCACKNPQEAVVNQLNDEVMKLHNETMPKMGDIYQLKAALKKQSETTHEDSTHLKEALLEAQLSLAKADDDMMTWMHHFIEGKNAAKTYEDKIKFFKTQKDSIQIVNNQIYMSIAIASKYVNIK